MNRPGGLLLLRLSTISLVGLLLACDVEDDGDAPPQSEPTSTVDTVGVGAAGMDAELPLLLTSTITRTEDGAEGGTVRVLDSGDAQGALMITIELNDAPAGSHQWEVHRADCAALTDPEAQAASSRVAGLAGTVEVGAAGFGEASAMMPPDVLDAGEIGRSRYSLAVLGGTPADASRHAIGCADL